MKCPKCQSFSIIKKGKVKTRKKGKKIQRFQCKDCKALFTKRNFLKEYREKKPDLDSRAQQLYVEGMTFRGIARYLKCDYKTVIRKFEKYSQIAKQENKKINSIHANTLKTIQLAEMSSYIQSKQNPISILLAVSGQGKILSFKSNENRSSALNDLLKEIIAYISDQTIFYFDSVEKYLPFIENYYPNTDYVVCSKKRADSFLQHANSTCFLIKNRLSRMSQKSWSFNRSIKNLQLSLELFQFSFNQKFQSPTKVIKMAEWIKEPFDILSEQSSEIKKTG